MEDFTLYLQLAFDHVLDWKAYDHILFFIALTVVYTIKDWKKTLWLITFFTIGHTTTLALATYDIVNVNTAVIEFLIPLTIFITALVNILTLRNLDLHKSNVNLIFALVFGFIHGMGLSGFLKMTLMDDEGVLAPLLEFALGVELAQMVIVFLVLALWYLMDKLTKITQKQWVFASSLVVAVISFVLMIQRKFW
ncbi:HupE/UreJ family protein [Flavobacteriaceae bacterium F08102]|nr:HupE/UreJ family protein [Flavobacteriaceae bacterium F08102]